MMHVAILAAIIVGGVVGLACVAAAYWVIRRRSRKRKPAMLEKRFGAFTLTGNLANEFTFPITEIYSVSTLLLGRGSSADVVIGQHKRQQRRYAIKMIDTSRKEIIWRYDREKNFLKDIEHGNIARLYEVYIAPSAMFFVTDLCTGGHLGATLKATPHGFLEEAVAKRYIYQILGAVIHCHNHGLCHRDIKLQNILKENNSDNAQVKLIDFGNAVRFFGKVPLSKVVGTTYTAAPEVFRKSYDERCDIWSLGVVGYILLSGRRPFERTEAADNVSKETSIIQAILAGKYHFKHSRWARISEEGIDFIKCCLELDYTRRSTALSLLDHPWFVYGNEVGATISPNGAEILRTTYARQSSAGAKGQARIFFMLPTVFCMPLSRIRPWRDVFQEIDRNANGVIERDEFRVVMSQVLPEVTTAEIDIFYDSLDQDSSGRVSYLEFLSVVIDPLDITTADMEEAFRLLDTAHKGYLVKEDVQRILCTVLSDDYYDSQLLSESVQIQDELRIRGAERQGRIKQRIDRIFDAVDLNKDGVISYTEYLFAMSASNTQLAPPLAASEPISSEALAQAPRQQVADSSSSALKALFKKRRQSDGDVRLEGVQFRTRKRSSFLEKLQLGSPGSQKIQPPTQSSSQKPTQDTPSGRIVPIPPFTPKPPNTPSPFQNKSQMPFIPPPTELPPGCMAPQTTCCGLVRTKVLEEYVHFRGKGQEAMAYVEDSPLLDSPDGRRNLLTSDLPINPTTAWAPSPPMMRQISRQMSAQSSRSHNSHGSNRSGGNGVPGGSGGMGGSLGPAEGPDGKPTLMRKLSSAFFPTPKRSRARTSPAILWTYTLTERNSLRMIPNPNIPTALLEDPKTGPRFTIIRQNSDEGDERVWNESDDSLDRASYKYLTVTAEQEKLLHNIRKKSGGSLDSHLFRQQMLDGMIAFPTSSKKVHVGYDLEACSDDSDETADNNGGQFPSQMPSSLSSPKTTIIQLTSPKTSIVTLTSPKTSMVERRSFVDQSVLEDFEEKP